MLPILFTLQSSLQLQEDTNIPILMTGVIIVTILLPSIPTLVGPYLPSLFEIFNRLAAFTVKKGTVT